MPVDFNTPDGATSPQKEGAMFGPVPLWERKAKARRSGRGAARDPGLEAGEPGLGAAPMAAAPTADPAYEHEPESFRYEPIRAERRRSGAPAGLIVAGVAAVAAISALGWYMNRPSESGMAELTPGAPGSGEVAIVAPPPASPLPTSAAGAPPGAPIGVTAQTAEISPTREAADAAARRTERAARSGSADAPRRPASRVRPADARSVEDAGVDASATAPMVTPPEPQSGATGPTLDMPPEQIDPSLDPTLPANRPSTTGRSPAAPPNGPSADDGATP